MLKKVAVDKNQINKLLKTKKYKEAYEYLEHVRGVIEIVAKTRVNKFIENKIILEKEKEVFISLIENNINNKMLEEGHYILVDEKYIKSKIEKMDKFKELKGRRRLSKISG